MRVREGENDGRGRPSNLQAYSLEAEAQAMMMIVTSDVAVVS